MRIDKQARGKTRKKYGRSVRRFAALVRWGSVVLGLLFGVLTVLGFTAGSMLTVLEAEPQTSSFYSQIMEVDDLTAAEDASMGIIGGADGPTSIMVSDIEAAAEVGAGAGVVAGVIFALIYIVVGWLTSSALYGFAEVIYCQEEIVAQNTKQIKLLEKIAGMNSYDEE